MRRIRPRQRGARVWRRVWCRHHRRVRTSRAQGQVQGSNIFYAVLLAGQPACARAAARHSPRQSREPSMPLAERRDPDCARESGAVLRGCLAAAWLPLLGCRCLAALASDRGRSVLRWAERRRVRPCARRHRALLQSSNEASRRALRLTCLGARRTWPLMPWLACCGSRARRLSSYLG